VDILPSKTNGLQISVGQPYCAPTNYLAEYDGPVQIGQYSKDLAFALYTPVPEPSSALLLLVMGLLCALGRRRR
jgi:hypothetical protein